MSQNAVLDIFWCFNNLLTSLNVNGASLLFTLYCHDNQLTALDVSQIPFLLRLTTYNNLLACLNVKNGGNSFFIEFDAQNNPNLSCIEVDDVTWSTANWILIDPASSFNTNCPNPCAVGILPVSIYPNPAFQQLYIRTELDIETISIVNISGKNIKTISVESKVIDIENLPRGIYFLKLTSEGSIFRKKL